MQLSPSPSPRLLNSSRHTKDRFEQHRRQNSDDAMLPPPRVDWDSSPRISPPSALQFRTPILQLASPPVSFTKPLSSQRRSSQGSKRRSTSISSTLGEDVLSPGDLVGEGLLLQDEIIRKVPVATPRQDTSYEPATEFEVVRRLGHGSYAVVYLVREVLSRHTGFIVPSADLMDDMEDDIPTNVEYGREYAIKCLSKANLDEEALLNQMSEVTIHQSLKSHPNIATHHRTLETSSFLLLVLEYVPGEDLFYFLEQARDHFEPESQNEQRLGVSLSRTPPTPALLASMHPQQLLSRTRLRLISSMFSQMCEAVAVCHDQQVFHRDIKPENFIVTDGWTLTEDGGRVRRVICKLTDFGLSTTDIESVDMDCGSAPYMSYECRNNVAPTYSPRAADVWSLGIVLVNMLYHYNPWTDTCDGVCSSFELFRKNPVDFFMTRFTGMTQPVAEFLSYRVFCILDNPSDSSQRISARDFGLWVKDLPSHFSEISPSGHRRTVSRSSTNAHPISLSVPPSRRPSSRVSHRAYPNVGTAPRSLSRAPSLGALADGLEASFAADNDVDDVDDMDDGRSSRSQSKDKRRKRGARKGKGVPPPLPITLLSYHPENSLDTLATASQTLAREISRVSRSSSRPRGPGEPLDPLSLPATPALPETVPLPVSTPSSPPPMTKKPSKWKIPFVKSSSVSVEEIPKEDTASTVTNILGALTATTTAPAPMTPTESLGWRGRRPGPASSAASIPVRRPSPPAMYGGIGVALASDKKPAQKDRRPPAITSASPPRSQPSLSPKASQVFKSASSTNLSPVSNSEISGNWRSSMSSASSANTSTSTFTKYSNSSSRSIATTNTSVSSATSWRTTTPKQPATPSPTTPKGQVGGSPTYIRMPSNIKHMEGVPYSKAPLDFNNPPRRPRRPRKKENIDSGNSQQPLDTISESRPITEKSPIGPLVDGNRSNLNILEDEVADDGNPKKVQKSQINALAKMLSALRR